MPKLKVKKSNNIKRQRPEDIDPDAIDPKSRDYSRVDWDRLQTESVEIDPVLVERIRSRRRLKQITLRVGQDQIDEAQRVATISGDKYQAVLRRWLAQGASLARSTRLRRQSGSR
jgi:hypothetical protein